MGVRGLSEKFIKGVNETFSLDFQGLALQLWSSVGVEPPKTPHIQYTDSIDSTLNLISYGLYCCRLSSYLKKKLYMYPAEHVSVCIEIMH